MPTRDELLSAARNYLQRHPTELARMLRGLLGLRLGLPLDALRWLASQAEAGGKLSQVEIRAVPPGLAFAATVDAMNTRVRASATIFIQRLKINREELRAEIRIEDVGLELAEDSSTPVAMLIKSGALDLSKPGTVAARLGLLGPMLIEGDEDLMVLDFLRNPKIAQNWELREKLELITSVITIHGIETDEGHLDVNLRLAPSGFGHAARTVNRLFLRPSMEWAKTRAQALLPGRSS